MRKQHSSEYFGDQRNHWWNADFLELMSKRLNLSKQYKVLDVGCGIGHWGQLIAPFLPSGSTLIGVDKEEKWIREAEKRAISLGLSN